MNRAHSTFASLALAMSVLCAPTAALAASDYYLEIEGVEGEAATMIDVESWSWGASNPGPAALATNLNSSRSNVSRAAQPPANPGESERSVKLNSSKSNTARTSNLNLSKSNVDRTDSPLARNGTLSIVAPRDAASGLTTGRSACAAGKHFAKAQVVLKTAVWQLSGVDITQCDGQSLSLSYEQAAQLDEAAAVQVVKSKSNITNN